MEISENVWLIATVVYVAGMFPLFYIYQTYPTQRFGSLATTLTIISIFGAVGLLFLHTVIGAWGKGPRDEDL